MPGEEGVTGRRPRRNGFRWVAAALLVVAAWAVTRSVGAVDRHQTTPPLPANPDTGGAAAFGHGFTPQELYSILKAGRQEGGLADGSRVSLTLNEELQSKIFELFRRFDPPYGVFAAMEPDTGRVVALVGYRRGGEPDPGLGLKAIYPAASLIKVITASAAIEKSMIGPPTALKESWPVTSFTIPGKVIRTT